MEPVAWAEAAVGPRSWRADDVFAALDLGTNNCRLLIARPSRDAFQVIDAFSRIVRLGEGVGRTGRLAPEAADRTIAALRICAGKMRRRRVRISRAVATEAGRRAADFDGFALRVAAATGLRLEVISCGEEARLALFGCAPLLDPRIGHALVFDIGGGSTELMWARIDEDGAPELIASISLPYGVVTLSERYGGDRIAPSVYDDMVAEVESALEDFELEYRIGQRIAQRDVQMLGSSGTVTTLAGVFLGLARYDRRVVDGSYLDFEHAVQVSRALLAMDFAARAAQPCIGRQRADLVIAGCAVLEAILNVWPIGRLRIADRGVREGILFELMASWRRSAGRHPRRHSAAL